MSCLERKRGIRIALAAILFLGVVSAWAPNHHRTSSTKLAASKRPSSDSLPFAEWAATGLVVASLVFNPLPTHATEIQSDQVTVTVANTAAPPSPAAKAETTSPKPEPPKAAAPPVETKKVEPAAKAPAVVEKKDDAVKKEAPKQEAPKPVAAATIETKKVEPEKKEAPKPEAPKPATEPKKETTVKLESKKDAPTPAANKAVEKPKASTSQSPSASAKAAKKEVKKQDTKKKQVSTSNSGTDGSMIGIGLAGAATLGGMAFAAGNRDAKSSRTSDSSYYNSMLNTSGNDDRFVSYRAGTPAERLAEERKRQLAENASRRRPDRRTRGSYAPIPDSRRTTLNANAYNEDRESGVVNIRAGTEQERRREEMKKRMAARRRDASTRNYRPISRTNRGSNLSSISGTDGFDRDGARFVNYRAGTEQERKAEQIKQRMAERRADAAANRGYRTNRDNTGSNLSSVSGTEGFNQGDDRLINYRAGTEQERRRDELKREMADRRANDGSNRDYRTNRGSGSDLGSISGTEGFDKSDARFVDYRAGTEQERKREQMKREMAAGRPDARDDNRGSTMNRSGGSDLSSISGTQGFNQGDDRFVNYRAGTEQERKAEQMKREMATGRPDAEDVNRGSSMNGAGGSNLGSMSGNGGFENTDVRAGTGGEQRAEQGSGSRANAGSSGERGADLYGSPGFHEFNSREPINYRAGTERERLAEERKRAMALKGGEARAYSSPSVTDYASPGFNDFNSRKPINYRAGTEGERLAEERKRAMALKGGEARAYSSPSGTDYGTPGFNDFNYRAPIDSGKGVQINRSSGASDFGSTQQQQPPPQQQQQGGGGFNAQGSPSFPGSPQQQQQGSNTQGSPTFPGSQQQQGSNTQGSPSFPGSQQQQQGSNTQESPSFPGSPPPPQQQQGQGFPVQGQPSFPGSPQRTGTQDTREEGKNTGMPW